MRSLRFAVLALVCVGVLLIPAHAGEKGQLVTISWPIEYAETSGVPDKVRSKCNLLSGLAYSTKEEAKDMNVVLAKDVSDSTEGWVLHMEIVNVIGGPAGSYTGPKSVTVQGKLTENGEVIGTFMANRVTRSDNYGEATCDMLEHCVKVIAKDIAKWLTNPTVVAASRTNFLASSGAP